MRNKEVFWAAVVGVVATALAIGGVAVSLGVKTPEAQFTSLRDTLSNHEVRISKGETDRAVDKAVADERWSMQKSALEELTGHILGKPR